MGGRRRNLCVLVAAGATLAGCAGGKNGSLAEAPAPGKQVAQLAAYAAAATRPADAPEADDLRVTAVVDRVKHTISLRNFTDQSYKDVDVWVNGTHVRRVPSLPARGGVVIHFGQFYDSAGASLAAQKPTVSSVQLKGGGTVYDLMGPAYD